MSKFRRPFERLTNVDEAKVIEVVEVFSIVGEGDGNGSPIRQIREYYSKDGELLARRDPCLEPELSHGVWSEESDDE